MTDQAHNPLITRRQALLGGTAALAGLGLAACGSSSGAHPSTSATAPTGPIKRGGNFKVGVEGNGLKDIMDAQNDLAKIDQARLVAGWQPLLEFNRDFELTDTGLAESVEPDGRHAYVIKLRQGVEFHNSKTMTADDVVYSFKRLTNPKLALDGGTGVTSVDPHDIRKLDKYTVRLGLLRPDVTIPDGLGAYACSIVPEGYTNTGRSWKQGQVGTGPFRLESFEPGQQSVHTRWKNYWQEGKPYLDQVTIIDLTDPNARMNALISGQVDAVADVPYSQAKLIETHSDLVLFNNEGGGWLTMCMRVDQEPFTDVRVRQAFRLIADRPQMLEEALAGYGRVANDLYAPFDPDYLHEAQRAQNIAQAKSLLKAAGKENLTVALPTSEVATGLNEMCQVFAQQAKAAGVTVKVNVLDATTFNNGFKKWTFSPDFWGTRNYLPQVGQSTAKGSPYNECHWPPSGSNFQSLYLQALGEQDTAKRSEIVHAMQHEEFTSGGYVIPFFDNLVDGYSKQIGGFEKNRGTLNLDYYGRHYADIHFIS